MLEKMATTITVPSCSFDLTFTPVRSDRPTYPSKYMTIVQELHRMVCFGLSPRLKKLYKYPPAQVRRHSV
jgi:hypothetical protein